MNDLTRRIGWAALCALVLGTAGCSKDNKSGGGCSADADCQRGEICGEDGACEALSCRSLNQCPGSGRTCLPDLKQCSAKECADLDDSGQMRTCPSDRAQCLDDGPFKFACVAPGSLACSADADCEAFGTGLSSCDGRCSNDCPPPLPTDAAPGMDMGPTLNEDAGPNPTVDAGMTTPDAAPMPTGKPCSPCQRDADCAALGQGASCTPFGQQNAYFCTAACTPGMAGQCPSGYTCVMGLNQCLPTTFRCEPGCLVDGCPEGRVCDAETGMCSEPRTACGTCASDADCAAGLSCQSLGGRTYCLGPCGAGGACDNGFTCNNDRCEPPGGHCDACGGRCAAPTPVCVDATGNCAECGPHDPCPDNKVCNLTTNACEARMAQGCVNDVDCVGNADGEVCYMGNCVQCLQDDSCGPGQGCDINTQHCVPMPCRGVACQNGAQCDMQTGRCNPGCQSANDCADPATMGCNPQTGQCYNLDGSCDPSGHDSVCAPGGTCMPNLLIDPNGTVGSCSCEKEDPTNIASPDRIPCQPGNFCLQLALPGLPPFPGSCVGAGM